MLVVDDDEAIRDTLRLVLEDAGYRVEGVADGGTALHRLRGSKRVSDVRLALFGPAALTALAARSGALQYVLPQKSFYAVHSHPKRFFEPSDFSPLIRDPEITGLHLSPKGRARQKPVPGSLHAWAAERFGSD